MDKDKDGKEDKKQKLIYVGPTITGDFFVSRFSVFNGLPSYLEKIKDNDFKKCFIPIQDFGRAKQDLKDKNKDLSKAVKAVADKFTRRRAS